MENIILPVLLDGLEYPDGEVFFDPLASKTATVQLHETPHESV